VALDLVGRRRWLVPALAAAVLATGIVAGAQVGDVELRTPISDVVVDLADQVVPTLHPGQVVLLQSTGGPYRQGLALQLERAGVPVAVPRGEGGIFGRHRAERRRHAEVGMAVVVAEGLAPATAPPDTTLVARSGRRSRREREAIIRRYERLDRDHRAGRVSDLDYLNRRRALPEPGDEVAVYRERVSPSA
jgi:hypothetical protein